MTESVVALVNNVSRIALAATNSASHLAKSCFDIMSRLGMQLFRALCIIIYGTGLVPRPHPQHACVPREGLGPRLRENVRITCVGVKLVLG